MPKKLSAAAALIVIFAFLSVSIVHACSGLGGMAGHSVTSEGITTKDPCNHPKGDFCKSVRDSLFSIKPSASAADSLQQAAAPLTVSVVSPTPIVFSPLASDVERPFHPVFKVPLALSYLVLRI